MTRHYCTLFDSRFLPQGLALYESLVKHSSEPFTLRVLPLDDECGDTLERLKLPRLIAVGLRAFERDQGLVEIRKQRTHQEYAWTCASNLLEWLLLCPDCELPDLTYIDSDVMFFSEPASVFNEIGERSIAITPHRLIPSKKHLEVNGRFNVGFVHFKNTRAGRACLSTWAEQTRERCSAEVGCGDQAYLDAWPSTYGDECCVIENIGVNAGPWSLANWQVTEGPRLDGVPLVAYHFHEYRHGERLTNYALRPEDREIIYQPYMAAVSAAKERIAVALSGNGAEGHASESRYALTTPTLKESRRRE